MKFSIVTPTLNQVNFIQESLESVISQDGDFEIEYWVIDGGSTDGTIDLLNKMVVKLSSNKRINFNFISEKDRGQSAAINKGLKLCTGEIMAYLNSDDYYLPGTLNCVAKAWQEQPELKWLSGYCQIIDINDNPIHNLIFRYRNFWLKHYSYFMLNILNFIPQPATFWRHELYDEFGPLREDLKYTMDYEYWLRMGKKYAPKTLQQTLSAFRIHNQSKGGTQYREQFKEDYKVACMYNSNKLVRIVHKIHNFLITFVYEIIK